MQRSFRVALSLLARERRISIARQNAKKCAYCADALPGLHAYRHVHRKPNTYRQFGIRMLERT
ncbi:hypothetical protein D3C80_2121340 [compost metagenome]